MAITTYYSPGGSIAPQHKIPDPAPTISITYNPYFAGDNIIGYDYSVTLKGYAKADFGAITNAENSRRVIEKVRLLLEERFNKNGCVFLVLAEDGTELLKATGSKVLSISVEGNDNLWTNYANYTIELTFNEIIFDVCGKSGAMACPNIIVTNYPHWNQDPSKDIRVHKIRSFSDGWTFVVDGKHHDSIGPALRNERFDITYRIEAQGAHHFVGDEYKNLIPAWEQAKNFCQERLYDQVVRCISNINEQKSMDNATDGTSPKASSTPTDLAKQVETDKGIYQLKDGFYQIYNEVITTSASEANGTFGLEYKAIVKRYNNKSFGALPTGNDAQVIHNVNPNKTFSDDGKVRNIRLSISGKIEGLVPSNLLSGNPIKLQKNGVHVIGTSNQTTKYNTALDYYNKIITGNSDFIPDYKSYYGITYGLFEVSCNENTGPVPSSFSVNHNYSEGTIEYNASFDSSRVCAGNSNYSNVDLILEDKIEQYAEIMIPGRATTGPLVQRLNTYSPRTITVNITGRSNKDCCWDIEEYANGVCPASRNFGLDNILPPRAMTNAVLTEDSNSLNPLDGSFSVTRKYTYYDMDVT